MLNMKEIIKKYGSLKNDNIISIVSELLKNTNFRLHQNNIFNMWIYNNETYKDGYIKLKKFSKIIEIGLHKNWKNIDDNFQFGDLLFKHELKLTRENYKKILNIIK